jgi:hypothetical protein
MTESLLHVPLVVKHPHQRESSRVAAPAALTAFPDVVGAARRGRREPFARDRVLAAKQPVTGDLRDRYEAAVADADPFCRPSRAVYEPAGTGLAKTYTWGDAVGRVRVSGAGAVEPLDGGRRATVEAAFADVADADLGRPRTDAMAEGTREHLEALGYF